MYERSSTVGSGKYIVCVSSRDIHNIACEMVKQTVSLSLNFEVCYSTTPHPFVAHLLTYLRSLLGLSTSWFSVFQATVFHQETQYQFSVFQLTILHQETRYPGSILAHEKIVLLRIIVHFTRLRYSTVEPTPASIVAIVQRLGVRTMLQPPMARMRAKTGWWSLKSSALSHEGE
jgi:hypothetical protein